MLIDWYRGKLNTLESRGAKLQEVMQLKTFYFLMKSEHGEYAVKDWNTLFRNFLETQMKKSV